MAAQDRRKGQSNEDAQPQANPADGLNLLANFESGLDSLRKLYAERQQLQEAVKAREHELAERTQELEHKSAQVADISARFEDHKRQVEATRSDLTLRENELAQKSEQLEQATKAHAEAQRRSEADAAAALKEIDNQRSASKREIAEIAEQGKALESRSRQLSEQSKALEQAQRQLADAQSKLSREWDSLNSAKANLEAREKDLSNREANLAALRARVEELDVIAKQAEKQIAVREQRIGELQERVTIIDRELQSAKQVADAERAAHSQTQQQASQFEKQTQQQTASLQKRLNELQGSVETLEHEAASFKSTLEVEKAAHSRTREEAGQLASRAAQQQAQFQAQLEQQFQTRIDAEVAKQQKTSQAQIANLQQQLVNLQKQLAAEAEAASNSAAQWKRELEEARERCAQAESDIAQADAASKDTIARLEAQFADKLRAAKSEQEAAFSKERESLRQTFADERRIADRKASERMVQAVAEATAASSLALEKRLREEMADELEEERTISEQRLVTERAKWEAEAESRLAEAVAHARAGGAGEAEKQLIARHEAERTKMTASFEQQIAELRASAEREKSRLAEERASLQDQLKQKIADISEVRTDFTQREQSLRAEYEAKVIRVREEASNRFAEERERIEAAASESVRQALLDARTTADEGSTTVLGLRSEIEELRSRLQAEVEAHNELREQHETSSHQLADSMSRVVALESRMRAHSEDGGHVAGTWRTPESVARHRQRLSLARTLIREQTDKVRKGSEALRKRYEQTEKVIAQRSELAQAREKIIDAERRVQSAAGKSKAAVVLLCVTLSIGILGGLSYGLARELAPATFVATSLVAADGRGRDLNLAEKKEWKEYHEKILKDSRFHEMAAERFQRSGIESLASPSQVKQLCENGVVIMDPEPGQLQMTLLGEGSTRTERVLDALTAALVSHANSAQTARVDGSVTTVKQQAKAGSDPVDKTRLYWALGMLGIGIFVCGTCALAIWRKLAGAKTQFERDTQLAAVLDQAKWGDVSMPDLKEATAKTVKKEQKKAA